MQKNILLFVCLGVFLGVVSGCGSDNDTEGIVTHSQKTGLDDVGLYRIVSAQNSGTQGITLKTPLDSSFENTASSLVANENSEVKNEPISTPNEIDPVTDSALTSGNVADKSDALHKTGDGGDSVSSPEIKSPVVEQVSDSLWKHTSFDASGRTSGEIWQDETGHIVQRRRYDYDQDVFLDEHFDVQERILLESHRSLSGTLIDKTTYRYPETGGVVHQKEAGGALVASGYQRESIVIESAHGLDGIVNIVSSEEGSVWQVDRQTLDFKDGVFVATVHYTNGKSVQFIYNTTTKQVDYQL